MCRIVLFADHLPGRIADQLDCFAQMVQEVVGDFGENGDAPQMIAERAFTVGAVESFFERLVPLQNVEHVAIHLVHRAVGQGAHRCRARVKTHAGHFAE